jgi:hypothetical protein
MFRWVKLKDSSLSAVHEGHSQQERLKHSPDPQAARRTSDSLPASRADTPEATHVAPGRDLPRPTTPHILFNRAKCTISRNLFGMEGRPWTSRTSSTELLGNGLSGEAREG